MPDFVRRIVSGPKARYVDPKFGFDLDLVYVTDRLIIMGWPASSLEALYRNRRKDVRKFLDAKHGEKYRVYNLCPCAENSYDADDFYGAVSRYPFPDHHPPPLSMIPMFVADVTAYFAEDPSNVVVIHCKAGKGRSGTMACSYLLSLPILPPPPQSSRNCGTPHDRKALEEKKRARQQKVDGAMSDAAVQDQRAKKQPSPQTSLLSQGESISSDQKEETLQELTRRLDAVFEFHTSRRLKPGKAPSSSTSSPLRSRASSFNMRSTTPGLVQQVPEYVGVTVQGSTSENVPAPTPLRPRKSLSRMVGTLSRKVSGLNMLSGAATSPERDPTNSTPPLPLTTKHENTLGLGRPGNGGRKATATNLRALGASPAGRSCTDLDQLSSLAPPLPAFTGSSSSPEGKSKPPLPNLSRATSSAAISEMDTQESDSGRNFLLGNINTTALPNGLTQSSFESPLPMDRLQPGDLFAPLTAKQSESDIDADAVSQQRLDEAHSRNATTLSFGGEEERETDSDEITGEVDIPRLAVSIPSQRRWVGYWARMLAGLDPRASLNLHTMQFTRRKIKLLRVCLDRRATKTIQAESESKNSEGSLSLQITRYNDRLVDRLETWERTARRRQKAYGSFDPSACGTSLLPSEMEADDEKDVNKEQEDAEDANEEAKVEAAQKRRLKEQDDERRWRDCERRNRENEVEYDRMMRQHGNDTGVGRWGVNVMAERDKIRNFHWNDEVPSQLETAAMVSESRREVLSNDRAAALLSNMDLTAKTATESASPSILRYIFEPGKSPTTHIGGDGLRPTWTKLSPQKKPVKSLLSNKGQGRGDHLAPRDLSHSNFSSDTGYSATSGSTPDQTTVPPSPTGSDEELTGMILDADREVQLKILLGRSGATHSKMPDMLSAGYIWFIPSFETPTLPGQKRPQKGQVVRCEFGMGEIDFRKGKKSAPLMGGGDIRKISVDFEWIDVGHYITDDDDDDDDDESNL